AVVKDIVIWITFFVTLGVILLNFGGYGNIFAHVPSQKYLQLPPEMYWAFTTSMLAAVLTAYLWPHNATAALSAQSPSRLKKSLALGPLYAVPLALIDILVLAVYSSPEAQKFLSAFPPSVRGLYTLPSLWVTYFPSWFVGLALVGVFVGGLVPAAIMALAQANLLVRNIIKEFKPDLPEVTETKLAKIATAVFKFIALAFVFTVAPTYAIQFYLVGAALLAQLLPAAYIGLYTRWPRPEALLIGMYAGLALSVYIILAANKFGVITTTLWPTPVGGIYLGIIALLVNLFLVVIFTYIFRLIRK
ncbi:MAG: sodium:solute symporter, partial [Thermoproteus sp.]